MPLCAYSRGMARQKMRPEFYDLHAATLTPSTTTAQLAAALIAAEGVQDRHRLSEGAVYASGCRRYLLDTGTPWVRGGSTADTTTSWGQSDHRYRAPRSDDPTGRARCSCGASFVPHGAAGGSAAEWHTTHVAEATGAVPA